ncbi:hypothetical protein [Rhodobacteraceae bacterium DSL-40]|uniref:hypothetical protein n=1 Tax=Amaricoccus sp. B4 TaxID=3368557 RepID=UPI000DABF0FB
MSARDQLKRLQAVEAELASQRHVAERAAVVEALHAEGRVLYEAPVLAVLVRDEREAKELEAQLGEEAILVACSREWKRRGLPD